MLYTIDRKKIEYIPHKKEYDLWKSRLSDEHFTEIMIEMEKVLNQKEVLVSSFIPGKIWEYPYQYIYEEACEEDNQNSAFFFGLLMWVAVQKHSDNWSFQKYESEKDIKGMTYFKITV